MGRRGGHSVPTPPNATRCLRHRWRNLAPELPQNRSSWKPEALSFCDYFGALVSGGQGRNIFKLSEGRCKLGVILVSFWVGNAKTSLEQEQDVIVQPGGSVSIVGCHLVRTPKIQTALNTNREH